jgi:hypothetical protein
MTEYDQGISVLSETVLNCNQIYDKVSLPDWYNGLQLIDLCLTELQIKAVSYQWWTGKYLIIMQYFTPSVFLNIVKAYFD